MTKISKLEQETDRIKNEQIIRIKEFEEQIRQLENRLADSEKINIQNEEEKNRLEKRLDDSEKMKCELQKRLDEESFPIKGQIEANVKNGLLINAKINLTATGALLDTSKSKCIISTNGSKSLGVEAYENGQPITSRHMNTDDILCKSGTYYLRCLVFDNQGKSKELVSNSITTKGTSITFDYSGRCETVSLLPGQYKLEV